MDNKELKLFSLRSLIILLYIGVVALIPLALRLRLVDWRSPVETWHRLASFTQAAEVFARFRLELLIIITILIVLAALLKIYYASAKDSFTNSYLDYPVALFAGLVILSALLSPYINVAFWGYFDRAEGAFAYLSYLIIFMVAAVFINGQQDKRIIFYACIAAGIIQSLIAISQFFGQDILKTDLAMRLYIPPEYFARLEGVDFRFAYKAYGMTYNPNYLGGYMAMLFPMALIMFLFAAKRRETIIWLVIFTVTLAGFLAPTSAGSFAAAGLALLIFFILTRGDLKRYYKNLIMAALILFIVAGVSEVFSGGAIAGRLSHFYRSTFGANVAEELPAAQPPYLQIPADEAIALQLYTSSFDNFASGRGYIWRKSLGMMQDTLLIGDGLDTFVYNFPHWDPHRPHDIYPIGLMIDNPHNTYIHIATGVGVIGLLVYLYIMFSHGKRYLQVFRRRRIGEGTDVIMLALFVGWLGYLFQGLSNDSVLSNAPVFWALFGISVNYVRNALQDGGTFQSKQNIAAPANKKREGKLTAAATTTAAAKQQSDRTTGKKPQKSHQKRKK